MYFNNENISVTIDDVTGITTEIINPADEYSMNWIIEKSNWGAMDGFEVSNVDTYDNKVCILCTRDKLQVKIEKEITDHGYFETYSVTNTDEVEFFLTRENFGIHFPYQCNYEPNTDIINTTCVSHVWCGGAVTWIYSVKSGGKAPYLVMNMIEGGADDYSISYDISRTTSGSYYRGAFVLHPTEQVILPGETATYKFFYRFSNEKPEKAPLSYNSIRFSADRYSLLKNETLNFTLETEKEHSDIHIYCDSTELSYKKEGNVICGNCSFDETGEKKIVAEVDGKKTHILVNVMASPSEILLKRAQFITDNQQYHRDGSHLDGAYLIYDSETKSQYCGPRDHNAGCERICMGIVVAKALQVKYDEKIMASLKKHRAFIERELFDAETGFACNDVLKNKRKRIFNFPWLSTYYLEWYNLTGEKACIENAANIILTFFEIAEYKYPAQCIEAVRICAALEKERLWDLHKKFRDSFLIYADKSSDTYCIKGECSWCSEVPSSILCYLSQAYLLSNDDKYLKKAESTILMAKSFWGEQPDFHLNCVPVRYWDRYWFGKYREYGDVFPQYWSALAGWGLAWYDKATGTNAHEDTIKANLYGNLCVFCEDGFAANNYLYPYKITLYTSDPDYTNEFMEPGVVYGKSYDKWANDQDWALYYASQFI